MKTTKLYMASSFHDIEKVGLENILLSYTYIPKDEKGIHRFHQAMLERRQLRAQEKNFNQNEK